MNSKEFISHLTINSENFKYFDLIKIATYLGYDLQTLPYCLRILLEQTARQFDLEKFDGNSIPFLASRVLLQDFTGVPVLADLAAMRETAKHPDKVNPAVPVDLVIDHSLMVDTFGNPDSLAQNIAREFDRNKERYQFLRWAQQAFENVRIVPPGSGIVHQVNLEFLASVVTVKEQNGEKLAYFDSVIGTDSHTTMVNALGVVGWGVGGIEAEAGMLGTPIYLSKPHIIGVRLTNELSSETVATDLALYVTEQLRKKGVVGSFIEFYGPGLASLSLADRATISNMAPEYGATMGYFPIDEKTLVYLEETGRSKEHINLVKQYAIKQGTFYTSEYPTPEYAEVLDIDLSSIVPALAGPKRPQDRVEITKLKDAFDTMLPADALTSDDDFTHGSVALAAITSCTNTSNPEILMTAGLLAKKACELGLKVPFYVKTTFTPGSLVVADYLKNSGLLTYLEQLGFHIDGFGCATCIGNSGPLLPHISKKIDDENLVVASVLSGNRNFEGRIHSQIKANFLGSPPLVIAYALAGTVQINLKNDPISYDENQKPIYLKDIWPKKEEVLLFVKKWIHPHMYQDRYAKITLGNEYWKSLEVDSSPSFAWDSNSTYLQKPPFCEAVLSSKAVQDARVLVLLEDSVTTDHISPAGQIKENSPAGEYLKTRNIKPAQFNSYGSRRGNHEIMVRGTFANIRLKNQLTPEIEGGVTKYFPTQETLPIYTAAKRYQKNNIPLIILAGKEYGTGSSRDWAAKGTLLLGVKAVIAKSFERIHRNNLVGMGVLPLQFQEYEGWRELGLTGEETFYIPEISQTFVADQKLKISTNTNKNFYVTLKIENESELTCFHHGGILPTVLKSL